MGQSSRKNFPNLIQKFKDLLQVVEGDKTEAEWMADDNRINLLSAHDPTEMGKALVSRVQCENG